MNELIQAYQTLFSHRQSVLELETTSQLESSIQIELLDELTHPRVRKSPKQKLDIAYERIEKSTVNPAIKQQLKELYSSVYNKVNSF